MKTYGELHVRLNGMPVAEFGDRAEAAAVNGWTRDRSKDREMNESVGESWLTFALTGRENLPPAYLFLTDESPGVLYVPNVVSLVRDQLSYDEYNEILKSFCDGVLARVKEQCPIAFEMTGETIDLAAQMPAELFRRLRTFSALANKHTGSSHPKDRERWLDFLVAAVESRFPLERETLARWLVEEDHWDEEQALRLVREYEFGRELLERQRRAS